MNCRPKRPVPEGSGHKMNDILDVIPENRRRVYDMHRIIECIVDGGKLLELKPDLGKMLITGFARINGEVVGLIANNPLVNAGAMDTHGLDKLTSMLCLCDSYNVPLVFLHDTPGHLVGRDAEKNKVSAKVINAMQALFQVTVPKISVIIRKSYGQAHGNMCGAGSGPDFVVAWPTAEIGFHGSGNRRGRGLRKSTGPREKKENEGNDPGSVSLPPRLEHTISRISSIPERPGNI